MLPTPTVARLSVVLSVLLVVLSPLLYVHMYAGDAEVHLVYGENVAHGRFFEFNAGEKSPGVTAPGYMLLLAVFYRVFPATSVPAVVKGVDLVCWYALIGVVFLLASRVFGNGPWPWATAVVATNRGHRPSQLCPSSTHATAGPVRPMSVRKVNFV